MATRFTVYVSDDHIAEQFKAEAVMHGRSLSKYIISLQAQHDQIGCHHFERHRVPNKQGHLDDGIPRAEG